jgi:NADH-quinone oxidoreductase subunit I
MGVLKDMYNLIKGMMITGKHLGRHAVTIQYPEEKWTMPERSRGIVVLLSDKETGELKRRLQSFDIDFGICCFCGLCEEACNFSAIKMANKYEFSTLTSAELIWDMKKLQDVGRDVDYIDTRKKKAPKEAAPKDAAATAVVDPPAPKEALPPQEESNG